MALQYPSAFLHYYASSRQAFSANWLIALFILIDVYLSWIFFVSVLSSDLLLDIFIYFVFIFITIFFMNFIIIFNMLFILIFDSFLF